MGGADVSLSPYEVHFFLFEHGVVPFASIKHTTQKEEEKAAPHERREAAPHQRNDRTAAPRQAAPPRREERGQQHHFALFTASIRLVPLSLSPPVELMSLSVRLFFFEINHFSFFI